MAGESSCESLEDHLKDTVTDLKKNNRIVTVIEECNDDKKDSYETLNAIDAAIQFNGTKSSQNSSYKI